MVGATDGRLLAWDLTHTLRASAKQLLEHSQAQFVPTATEAETKSTAAPSDTAAASSQQGSLEPLGVFAVHQSGVNCLSTAPCLVPAPKSDAKSEPSDLSWSVRVVSGGDDEAISVLELALTRSGTADARLALTSSRVSTVPSAHFSSITGDFAVVFVGTHSPCLFM